MYICNVVITYNYYDKQFKENNEKQNIDLTLIDCEDMTDDISETLYRAELLGVFGLEEFDDKVINLEVMNLCTQLSTQTEFAGLMLKAAAKMFSVDLCTGLMVLFSYDSFFLLHRCICEFLKTGIINSENLDDLTKSLDPIRKSLN
jgi:hypothetical protein